MTTDGYLIAAHTAWALYEGSGGTTAFPSSQYDFRLKFLQLSNGFYVPSAALTQGLTNRAAYWNPDALVTHTNLLWELDPVEVVARPRPARLQSHVAPPEQAAFVAANVDVAGFQNYLRTHDLALIVSRDVTTRDKADRLQPFNRDKPSDHRRRRKDLRHRLDADLPGRSRAQSQLRQSKHSARRSPRHRAAPP
jgi:hypothetical protein